MFICILYSEVAEKQILILEAMDDFKRAAKKMYKINKTNQPDREKRNKTTEATTKKPPTHTKKNKQKNGQMNTHRDVRH